MSAFKDLTGQRFGRLFVIEREGSDNQKRVTWRCRCACGRETVVASSYLLSGNTKSCGCLRNEVLIKCSTKHGKRHTRLYDVWRNMKGRCYNPKNRKYDRYGGRGITICDEWKNDFQTFYEWAMANGYDENALFGECTLDRIDNQKGYSPDNCRWVGIKTQNNNRGVRRWKKRPTGEVKNERN